VPPIRRCQFVAANSALGQFGTGSARRWRFGAGTFRRIVINRDIKIINELKNYRNHMFAAIDVQDGMNCNLIYSVHLEIVGESTQIVHDAVVCIALHSLLDSFVTQSISSKLPRRSVSGDQLLMECHDTSKLFSVRL